MKGRKFLLGMVILMPDAFHANAREFLKTAFFPEPKVTAPTQVTPLPPTFEGKAFVKDSLGNYVPIESPLPPFRPFESMSPDVVQVPGYDVWIQNGSETSIAVNSADGENSVGAWNQLNCENPNDPTLPHGYTTDGNLCWTLREFPRGIRIGFPYDPWVVVGNSPGEFFSTLIRSDDPCGVIYTSHCIIARTADGGGSFSLFFEKDKRVMQDKEAVDIDRTMAGGGGVGAIHDGKVYLGYDDRCFGGVDTCVSRGSYLQVISPSGTALVEIPISPAYYLQPVAGTTDGEVFVKSGGQGTTYFHEITNGGAGPNSLNKSALFWSPPGQPLGGGRRGLNGHRIDQFGYLDIDRSDGSRRGDLYFISNRNPNASDPTRDQGDIYLSVSTDGASTWSSAMILTALGKTQYFPMMDVDEQGWIHVAYYQNETGSANGGVLNASTANIYYTFSTDGGLSWYPPKQVNSPPNPLQFEDPPPDRASRNYYLIGDYAQIQATGTDFSTKAYILWSGYNTAWGYPRVFCTTVQTLSLFNNFSQLNQLDGANAGDRFGYAVADAGDVNGDGNDDFIVGAPYADPGGVQDAGSVFVYSGTTQALLYQKDGGAAGGWFGRAVSGGGDVDGDGKDDFIVGAPSVGSAYVYSGATGNLLFQKNGIAQYSFGFSVAMGGDADADGRGDFMVGQNGRLPFGDFGVPCVVYVYSGATGALLRQINTPPGSYVSHSFTGDLNGDGGNDIIIGQPFYKLPFAQGSYFAVYSGTTGSNLYGGSYVGIGGLGHAVAGGKDVNGDGTPDFMVGDPFGDLSCTGGAGFAFVYSGANGGLLHQVSGSAPGMSLGYWMATADDLNGDGKDDFLLGSPGYGYAFAYSGSDASLLLQIKVPFQPPASGIGNSLATAVDLNGDQKVDMVFGAPYADPFGLTDAGSVFIYTSNFTPTVARGDMNGDGILTASDVVLELNCVFLGLGFCPLSAADMNCDGFLTAADIVILLNLVFLGTPPPC